MRLKQQEGKKTRSRDKRVPEQEFEEATYRTAKGECGIPLLAIKSAIIGAAHKDIGIEKTLVKKALFIPSDDPLGVLPIKYKHRVMREDPVRVGQGSADLRYRPEFSKGWTCEITAEVDTELLQVDDLINLVDRAGFGVGIGEWRPEKEGEFGRFRVDSRFSVKIHRKPPK